MPTLRHLSITGHLMQIDRAVSMASFLSWMLVPTAKSSGKNSSGTFSHSTPSSSLIASCRSSVMRFSSNLSEVMTTVYL